MFQRQLIKFFCTFLLLYSTSVSGSEDAAVNLVTLKNGNTVAQSWVTFVQEKLEKIKNPRLLSVLARAFSQDDAKINHHYRKVFQEMGIFKDNRFLNPKVEDIIGCSLEIDPESHVVRLVSPLSDLQPVWVRLSDNKLVDKKLVEEVTAKLEPFKDDAKALRQLGGYSSANFWELPAFYRKLFIEHEIINGKGHFASNDVRAIVSQSISFKPYRLINPLKQEPIKQEIIKAEPLYFLESPVALKVEVDESRWYSLPNTNYNSSCVDGDIDCPDILSLTLVSD